MWWREINAPLSQSDNILRHGLNLIYWLAGVALRPHVAR